MFPKKLISSSEKKGVHHCRSQRNTDEREGERNSFVRCWEEGGDERDRGGEFKGAIRES